MDESSSRICNVRNISIFSVLDALAEEDFLIEQKNITNSRNYSECTVKHIDSRDEHCTVRDFTVSESPASDISGECSHSSSATSESSVSDKPQDAIHYTSVGFDNLTLGEISMM